jgi:hypothetical protein
MFFGCPGHAAAGYVREVRDGIGRARVFSQRTAIQIDPARPVVDRHVFQDSAEVAGGLVNLWFALVGEPDDFGIAAAFEIEHAVFAPPVFVIAD